MIKIRLAKFGKRNNPFYRIIAIENRSKREGKFIDILGFWDKKNKKIKIDKEKLSKWKRRGAQVTKGVENLL